MSDLVSTTSPRTGQRQVSAEIALAIFEVIRLQDHPVEVLDDEDVSRTMPRRLGLSDVIDQQIRTYREYVRKRRRLTDRELADLLRLVLRRPDATEIFVDVGVRLARAGGLPRRPTALAPMAWPLARRRLRRRLKALFGRRVGSFGKQNFSFAATDLPLIAGDPEGRACALVTGLCQEVIGSYLGGEPLVVEQACQASGDPRCRWTLAGSADPDSPNTSTHAMEES